MWVSLTELRSQWRVFEVKNCSVLGYLKMDLRVPWNSGKLSSGLSSSVQLNIVSKLVNRLIYGESYEYDTGPNPPQVSLRAGYSKFDFPKYHAADRKMFTTILSYNNFQRVSFSEFWT
jgi:hypothetical protein